MESGEITVAINKVEMEMKCLFEILKCTYLLKYYGKMLGVANENMIGVS